MKLKVFIGIFISCLFIYLTFRQVDFEKMIDALKAAKYYWLLPSFIFMGLSHLLRALRWQYLMSPVKQIKVRSLFSALMIGYAANNIFPLRLGEFLRAYAIGKSEKISKSASFATVVVERFVLDLMALLILLVITLQFYPGQLPYHELVKIGGYLLLVCTLGLILLIVFLMKMTEPTLRFLEKLFPPKFYEKLEPKFHSFLSGCEVFKKTHHYFAIFFSTLIIWLLYIASVYILFYVFDFTYLFDLNVWSSIIILVVVTFSIMLPSAPGALGTYHFLCTEVLNYFGVPDNEAVSYSLISHAMNVLPFTIIGIIYFWKENLKISDVSGSGNFDNPDSPEPLQVQ